MLYRTTFRLLSLVPLLATVHSTNPSSAQSPTPAPVPELIRCELVPLPDRKVDFQVDGLTRLQWHASNQAPRPFFFPFIGPGRTSLLRMGHPGAPDHDHHRGIWFAHHDVDGISFWGDGQGPTIEQTQWLTYQEEARHALMAVRLSWRDADRQERLSQDLIAILTPDDQGQLLLELQSDFRPGGGRDSVRLGKTNFGFLAVRVARALSARYGNGKLSNSEGAIGEKECFAKPAKWIDYSGPLPTAPEYSEGSLQRSLRTQGITYFDHPGNLNYPTHWHVRDDGWMGAGFNLQSEFVITKDKPLRLRYLLWLHDGPYEATAAPDVHARFATTKGWTLSKSTDGRSHFVVTEM